MREQVIFKDKEIGWFYGIILGLLAFTFLLVATDREWLLSLMPLTFMIGFAYFGWPLKVRVVDNDILIFEGLLRRTKLAPDSIVSVRVVGAHDYRAHVVLRAKNQLPIGYRCHQYDRASELAQMVIDIIDRASDAKIQPDARRLLQQVAEGKTTPIPSR